ncbi:MAG: flagellar hook-basal body complex protein FliE [Verrucomicrobia bacterium]|jgi:flagellar hook-basal body complex protein FliE|nr:flagellar hook-basal body complex protein FliE [Verrucomicrobiota bacterium]
MNPLSALRTIAHPALRAEPMRPPTETGAPKAIPFSELEKLSPGILPMPIDTSRVAGASGAGFQSLVGDLVSQVASKQAAASESVNQMLSGQNVSLHQTMIAMEEASISFQLMVEVRNKLLESYQELMRMQV